MTILRVLFVGLPNALVRELVCLLRGHRPDESAPSAHGRKLCRCCHRRVNA